jgi:CHAT domain-containing protein
MPTNPFVTSTAVRSRSLFFGRQEEIKQLYTALSANPPQHSVVIGLPKSGKSSLLMVLASSEMQKQYLADPSQFLFVPVDCSVANLDAPADLYVRLIERIALACGQPVGGGNILDRDAFVAAVSDLRAGRRMILLLDEFDVLLTSDGCSDEVLASMRGFVGSDIVVVATACDTIERLCRRVQKTQAEIWTLFSGVLYPRLLTREESRQAIKQPIGDAGVATDDAAVDLVIDLVGPHPFFLQVGGKELFDAVASGQPLDAAGQAQLRERLSEITRSYFNGFWRAIGVDDQAVLAAIIAGAGLPPKALAVAQRLRNWNLLVLDQDDYVPFSKLFGDYAKATLLGEQPKKMAEREQPRCVLSIVCDSYAKNVAVRLQGSASFVAECDEPLDRNIRFFAIRGREDARSDRWRELIKITGRELYQKLFDSHLTLAEAYQSGRTTTGDTRLRLRFMGPRDFVGLPFELLHDDDSRPLALDHPISRMVTGQICTKMPIDAGFLDRQPTADAPRSALIISANVSGEIFLKGRRFGLPPIPGAENEGLKVKSILEERSWQVKLLSGPELTLESASAALDSCKYDLIHFCGHGFYAQLDPESSGLVLRNQAGDIAVLEALRLRQLLKDSRTRFVFLSCCEGAASGDAAQLLDTDYLGVIDGIISAGVPAALGYRWPVSSSGATTLAVTFYDKLHQHESLETALLLARQEVRSQFDDQTWISPILVVQE